MTAQLLAKPHHLTIDRTIRGWVVRPLNGLDDLLTCMHSACTAGKNTQQTELDSCQRNRPAVNKGFPTLRSENNPVDLNDVGIVGH